MGSSFSWVLTITYALRKRLRLEETKVRLILRCPRDIGDGIDPRRPTRQLSILSREHLRSPRRPQRVQRCRPPRARQPIFRILSAKVRRLGQYTLVLESSPKPYLCPPCDVATALGASIRQDHSIAVFAT
jgi:hypothetical protein